MNKGNLKIKWNVEVKNKAGKTTFKKAGIAKSLLRNFMYWLHAWFTIAWGGTYATSWTAPDTGNISRTFPYASASAQCIFGFFDALANNSLSALRVGSGDTAVTPVDYELAALIAHGSTSGLLVYNTQTVEAVTVVGQNTSFRVSRSFTNNSGATITIKEIGAAEGQNDSAGVVRYLLYLRDVLPSSVPVPDGSTFTLRYTFTVTA